MADYYFKNNFFLTSQNNIFSFKEKCKNKISNECENVEINILNFNNFFPADRFLPTVHIVFIPYLNFSSDDQLIFLLFFTTLNYADLMQNLQIDI